MSPSAYNARVFMWPLRKPDFETAVRRELPVLYRVARRMVRNEDEAADLVQQALVKAFGAWRKFDGKHVRSWLIKILRNENLMRIRSDARAELVELEEGSAVDSGFWDEVFWRNQVGRLLDELDGLPEEFKMAVVLCDVEQLSYEEAALSMDVPIGTVRSRLSRGRAMLRIRLTDSIEVKE
jgi:RNA polymerase sigma-70 factor (ECF subfamily)